MGRKPVKVNIMEIYANPQVFFLTDEQEQTILKAIDHANEKTYHLSKAILRRRALVKICREYLDNHSV